MEQQYNIPPEDAARVMPNSPKAERSALGAMLRSRRAAQVAVESLRPDDFYDPANREIYSAMKALSDRSRPIDLTTLDDELTRRGKIDAVGGGVYLVELSRGVPSSDNIRDYIKIIDEKSTLRKLIGAAETILRDCYDGESETRDILEAAEKAIYNITMRKGGEQLQAIQPVLIATFERIEQLVKNHGRIEGVPTGYTELDDLLTGLHPGELVLVAGRPAMGKTSIGMNFIENAAIRAGKKAAVFSLEMPAEQLAMRMLCTEARVNMQNVRRGQIGDDEWERLCDALVSIGPASIHIDCTPGITVPELRSKARRLQLEHGLDVIMIDYLSLMSATGKFGSRQEEVSQISRTLKGLSLELGVPVIALQQLSRAPTGRANHRPLLSDIRESGAIEQDADVVMFIHREEYYDPDTPDKGMAELIIAKQRNGALGTVKLGWKGEYTWFTDLSPHAREAVQQSS
ncbi:MAG: replicative DNA helicase [Clostridia bacterium]|nr:replicative DNA helicase [Clostridia bacterium]